MNFFNAFSAMIRSNQYPNFRGAVRLLLLLWALVPTFGFAAPIRVVVWDEREEAQTRAYVGHFLGDTLAAYLKQQPGMTVQSVGLNDPEQGLSADILGNCDVLIWWGHEKHQLVTDDHVNAILERLRAGKMGFVALHSGHWSKPFIGAMNIRTVDDALKTIPAGEREKISITKIPPPRELTNPKKPITPYSRLTKSDGKETLEVHLPACVFAVVRADAEPSSIHTLDPQHPVAAGIPDSFTIPETEVYSGAFSVPKPDTVVFQEQWKGGETFTSGCAWQVEKGRVFYFRPGHEIYPIFKEEYPLKIVKNAVLWVKPNSID